MKLATTILFALILSHSSLAAAQWTLIKSPKDGIVEIEEGLEDKPNRLYYFNAAQIVQLRLATDEDGITSISFSTTENRLRQVNEGAGSESSRHFLEFKKREDAKAALKKILGEITTALGTDPSEGVPSAKETPDDRPARLNELQAAQLRFQEIKERYQKKHPEYIRALRRIQELEKKK